MNSLKTNLIYILIIALLVIILYETCKSKKSTHTYTSSSDTLTQINYVYYRDTSRTKPIYLRGSRDTIFENRTEYLPSEDYKVLVSQFEDLKQILLSKNIYIDSLALDSLGWVKITDTVQRNAILGRNIVKNIIIPEKIKTINNNIYIKKRQVYFGGGMFFNPHVNSPSIFGNNVYSGMTSATGGLLYKSKTDQIIGASLQWDGKQTNYGVSAYIKLSFKKDK